MTRPLRLLGIALLVPTLASASKPRCKLERVEPRGDELRVYANVVELEGQVVEGYEPAQFTLDVDGRSAGRARRIESFARAGEAVEVALLVEVAAQYGPAIEKVKGALHEFLEGQPASMRASLVAFGSDLDKKSGLVPAPSLASAIDDLVADDDSVDLRLVEAVRLGLAELGKSPVPAGKLPPRRLIVLVSDGLNGKMDRTSFRRLGDEAARAGVPIHSVAFSPIDERGPLLNLGEISKRSNGTFRWAKRAADLPAQLANLADEVRKQYVLTFAPPPSAGAGKGFLLHCGELVSNPLGESSVAAPARARMRGWWRLPIVAAVGLALLSAALFVLARRRAQAEVSAPPMPGAPAVTLRGAAPISRPPVNSPVSPAIVARHAGVFAAPAATVKRGPGGVAPAAAPPAPAHPARSPQAAKPRELERTPVAAAGGRRATLIAIGGHHAGSKFGISASGTFAVGTAAGVTLQVEGDGTVSGRHAEFVSDVRGVAIRDLASRNGTFVNNQRVTGTRPLVDGDVVRLGSETQFKVRID